MKQGLKKHCMDFLLDEEGQSTTEYILILAVVVMIAMKFKEKVGALVQGRIENISGQLNEFDKM